MTCTLPFAVNQYLRPAPMSPTTFLDRIVQVGFQGAGITQSSLDTLPAPGMAEALDQRGLRVTSLNSAGFFLFEGQEAHAQEVRNRVLLQQACELGQARLNVIVGGSSTLPLRDARALASERLIAFAHRAAALGVELMLEPLHHLNVRSKSCFNSIAQLTPLFDRLPNLTLNADLFHLWWDPDLDAVLRGASLPLGLVQICDVAMSEDAPLPRRVPLGEGILSWANHVRIVRAACPAVPIELELFADQLPDRSFDEILASSFNTLTNFMKADMRISATDDCI